VRNINGLDKENVKKGDLKFRMSLAKDNTGNIIFHKITESFRWERAPWDHL